MRAIGRIARLKLRKTDRDVLRALRFIVSDAAEHVPFYRVAFSRAGVGPEALRRVEDLRRFPITDKRALFASGETLHLREGANERSLDRRSTSGTQGRPLTVYANRSEALFRKVTLLDSFRRSVRLRFPLTIADVGAYTQGSDIAQRLGLVRIKRIFRTTPLAEQAAAMSRLRPDVVEGRPSSLWSLVAEARRLGLDLPRPRVVISFAETLFPHVRAELNHAFGCRVADYYNCEEVGNVAWECPRDPDRMHVNSATSVLEVVDEDGEPASRGQVGRVLLTNLFNTTMPFIRYEIRDRAALLDQTACSCGFRGTSIRLVEGREEDFFLLPDGREISPRRVNDIVFGLLPGEEIGNELFQVIEQFQIVQEDLDFVIVNVIPGPKYTRDLWRGIEESAKAVHPALRVSVREVDVLELAPGGKFKPIISRVAREEPTDSSAASRT